VITMAATVAGLPGIASLMQTNTRNGRRSSTYRAFLQGEAESRANLTIIAGAQAARVVLQESSGKMAATTLEYRTADGQIHTASALKEVILSAGAVGSPHLLMLSGIGPAKELEKAGVSCLVDSPHVGKHLKDHVQVPLFFHSSASGVRMSEVGVSLGPDALRQPAGPLPADPAEDANLPPDLKALRDEAGRRITEWAITGRGLISSSLYDAGAWFSTGLGDLHSHDAQIACIPCGCDGNLWALARVDTAQFFDDVTTRLAPDAANIVLLANPVQPHSEGEIVLESADPGVPPAIRMNYYGDSHDMKVMVAILRRRHLGHGRQLLWDHRIRRHL
jgi:choline dehydrogenase